MRITLISPVVVDEVEYTQVVCALAMSDISGQTSLALRLTLSKEDGEIGPDIPGIVALGAQDSAMADFFASVTQAIANLLVAKGL